MPTIFSKRHPQRTNPLEFVVLQMGVPNKNGRTYLRQDVAPALLKFNFNNDPKFGVFKDDVGPGGTLPLNKVAFVSENVHIRGDKVYATVKPLKTPAGLVLEKLLALDLVEFRTLGTYSHLDNGCIKNWKLIAVVAMSKGEGA